ncbi:MAG TPA: hypothetical protein VFK30_09275 [Anaerolineae bacterium]|nr:hypothetical protein [Anaerolineae bacterium]
MNLAITREKTGVFFLTITQSDGTTPQDLTGLELWFHTVINGIAIDKHSPSSGITIVDATGGLATLQIEPSDTAAIPASGIYSGDCELTLQAGSEAYELVRGTFSVSPNVGLP